MLYPALRRELEENQAQLHRFDVNGLLHLSCNIVVHHPFLGRTKQEARATLHRGRFPRFIEIDECRWLLVTL
jgi:hypothetical protein